MFRCSVLFAALLALFATQAMAISVNLTTLGVFSPDQLVSNISDPSLGACATGCNNAVSLINACGVNDTCVCALDSALSNSTAAGAFLACQECMFTSIVHDNRRPQDAKAGSAAVITAFATACNITTKAFALAPPSDWDGPFGQGLTTLGTVVSVIAAATLGSGLITVLNTM